MNHTAHFKTEKELERFGSKGLKLAILLAHLGVVEPLARLMTASEIAMTQTDNLLHGLFPREYRKRSTRPQRRKRI